MDRSELDEFKNINKSFNYDTGNVAQFKRTDVEPLTEEVFDDFDTAYESLKTGIELELRNFIVNLLVQNVEKFLWSFENPTSETFSDAWGHVLTKFTVRDEASREQFLNRMRILFRNLFLDKFNIKDEDSALELADQYFAVFNFSINKLLKNMDDSKEGTSTDAAQDSKTDDLVYR